MVRKIVALGFVFFAFGCATRSHVPANGDAVAVVTARFNHGIEAFNRHDLESFLDQFADDIEMYTPTGWLRGKAAVRARFVETFTQFPAVRMETDSLRARLVGPDVVVVDFAWRVFPQGAGPAFHGVSSGVYVSRAGAWVEVHEHEVVTRVDAPLPGTR